MLVSRSELVGKVLATAKCMVLIPLDKIPAWERGDLYVNIWDDEGLPHMGTSGLYEHIIEDPDPKYDRFRACRKENFKLVDTSVGPRYTEIININDEIKVNGVKYSVLDRDAEKLSYIDILYDVFRNCGIVSVHSDELLNWSFADVMSPDGKERCSALFLEVEDFSDYYRQQRKEDDL